MRSLLGAGLILGLVGVIGTALGALLRSVACGISVLVASLMLVPGLISLLPTSWQDNISPYLPNNVGESMFAPTDDDRTLAHGRAPGLPRLDRAGPGGAPPTASCVPTPDA